MRLTLRTLLAYLDDILDPQDAEQLQKKIEDSEFATSLVHQIRGSVRRLRLDAPALDAQGIGGDLNSVAEYLDNVLPPEQVPSLEKSCLDNEVSLGEVASCHQILTLVLGEPANVTDNIRHRAYGIAPTIEPTTLPPSPTTHVESHAAHPGVPTPTIANQSPPPATESVHSNSNPPTSSHEQVATPTPESHEAEQTGSGTVTSGTVTSGVTENSEATSAPTTPKPSRPADHFKNPGELPSTREAWRAEARESLAPIPDTKPAPAADEEVEPPRIVAPPKPRAVTVPIPGPAEKVGGTTGARVEFPEHPEYMDRKSSWLRSAFVTGIVALLILAGLLFATSPTQDNLFARWFGKSNTQVVDNSSTDQLAPLNDAINTSSTAESSTKTTLDSTTLDPATNAVTGELTTPADPQLLSTQQVETAEIPPVEKPNRWVDPPSAETPERPSNTQLEFSKVDEPGSSLATAQVETQLDPSQSSQPIPELMTGETFENNLATTNPPIQPLEEPNTPPDVLPTVEPASNAAAVRNTSNPPLEQLERNSVPVENNTEDIVVVPNPAPREEVDLLPHVPRVPPAPRQADSSLARTESANIPQVGIAAPLVDPEIDRVNLEEAPINPPVASPAANVVSDPSLTVRLPVETKRAPEPKIGRTLETTKLQRADQLLLVFDTSTEAWKRVDSSTPLNAGDFIQSLPAFRADVEIGSDIVCTLVHASRVQLGPQADLTLHDGKLILKNAKAGSSQGVRFQGEPFNIEMNEDGGVVAMEAMRMHVPGADVTEMPHTVLKIHPIGGNATVAYMDERYDLQKDSYLLAFDNFKPTVVEDEQRPEWATTSTISPADANAVRYWKRNLEDADSIRDWLRERSETRRYNERALAARCLAELDEFSAIVSAFSDKEQHAFWDRHFEVLRRSLTRGAETVDKLKLELEKVHGDKADFLMELIRGYSKGQLSGGAAAKLVKYLSHPELDHRVLAFQNLRTITAATQSYQPEKPARVRQGSIRRWNSRLKQNRIVYKEVPEVVRLLEQFAKTETKKDAKDAN